MDDLISQLRRRGRVEVDEHLIEYAGEWQLLKTGDQYLGKHGDNKPELLTCRRLEVQRRASGRTTGKVFPKERKKRLYNLEEVIRVIIRNNPNWDPTKEKKDDGTLSPADAAGDGDDGPETESESTPGVDSDRVSESDGLPAAADDRSGQREDSSGNGEAPKPDRVKPGPKPQAPAPTPGDPRQRAGRTDYTAATRKSD